MTSKPPTPPLCPGCSAMAAVAHLLAAELYEVRLRLHVALRDAVPVTVRNHERLGER